MHSDRKHPGTFLRAAGAVGASLILSGCMTESQSAPPLAGPSGFGKALTVTASPDIVARDGSSQSTIRLNYRDGATNAPIANKRVVVTTTAGTLSVGEVRTDTNGNASLTFTAPTLNTPASSAAITAVPEGDNVDNGRAQLVTIALVGPDVPTASFTVSPESPSPGSAVTFNASGTLLGKDQPCKASCRYDWDFGDGSNNSDAGPVVQHTYTTTGVVTVTLTVFGPAGTSNSTSTPVVLNPPAPPVALWDVTPASPKLDDQAAYESKSTVGLGATIVDYNWEFDDGDRGVTPIVLKAFHTTGVHIVKLTVRDSLGRSAALTKFVTVVP